MTLTLACAFATGSQSHEHAVLAEELGYERAWFYDSPALYPDVWVQLCRAAERTSRIGVGPAVLVPSLRHPMTNAAAIATLVEIAGEDRVAITVGSGFTGRMAMGQRALRWSYIEDYVNALRGLLQGLTVEWEGKPIRMLHADGFGAARPIDVPILIAAAGPRGIAVAKAAGDGVFGGGAPIGDDAFDWRPALIMGTVLEEGEDPGSERAIEAAGHAASVGLHYALEHGLPNALPRGAQWVAAYDAVPSSERHLALHDRHLVAVNAHDRAFVTGEVLQAQGLALDREAWRKRLAALEADGATEVAYQPAGNDIPRELEAFAGLFA